MPKKAINEDYSYWDVTLNFYPTPVEHIHKFCAPSIQEYITHLRNDNFPLNHILEITCYSISSFQGRTRINYKLRSRYNGTILKTALAINKRKNK
jgi:hypothetical protein